MLRHNSAQVSLKHIWAVTRKEIHHIMRDRSTLILVLLTPTALLLLRADGGPEERASGSA